MLSLAGLLLGAGQVTGATGEPGVIAPEVTVTAPAATSIPALKDQYGTLSGFADLDSDLTVAIVVSAKRLRRIRPWEQALREQHEDVAILRVADVPRASPASYDDVARTLRKRLPEDLNVLIDLEGLWTRAYGLDPMVPTLLVFDRHGGLLARHAGMYRPERFQALAEDLDRIRASVTVSPAVGQGAGNEPADDAGQS